MQRQDQKKYSFLIINGPNLGCLGKRQPEIYGSDTLEALPHIIHALLEDSLANTISLEFFQSNHEGNILDRLEKAQQDQVDGIVINAGALTHTSLALADCLAWIHIPYIEVHISNVLAREEQIRHTSFIGKHAKGIICGLGMLGYALAVRGLYELIEKESAISGSIRNQ